MKTRILSLIVIAMTVLGTSAKAQSSAKEQKVLVAYFSRSGNTRAVADHIKSLTGGDLFEIQVANPYPEEYHACTEVAKKEKEDNARPALKTKVDNLSSYDVIFVGFPNWWGTMPMPILTFLESYDLSGKVVIPFCTPGGGGEQNCFKDFEKHTSKAENKKGFLVSGGQAASARPQVESWLKGLKVIQ